MSNSLEDAERIFIDSHGRAWYTMPGAHYSGPWSKVGEGYYLVVRDENQT